MSQQLNLFDAIHPPPILVPVQPRGEVVRGEVDTHLFLPHPRLAWHLAEIELHPYEGMWMWSVRFNCDNHGGGYRVGPKWGNFAVTKGAALHYAVQELEERLGDTDTPTAAQILRWARRLA